MASEAEVRKYLAQWFQLGKKVLISNGEEAILPKPVIEGNSYSRAFEDCWQKILTPDAGDSYLQGTNQTIVELLSPAWVIISCANCYMPVPVRTLAASTDPCPCNDLYLWPNKELPQPRVPIDSQKHLQKIYNRLNKIVDHLS